MASSAGARKKVSIVEGGSSSSEWQNNWDDFRNPLSTNLFNVSEKESSVLARLENEDVDDPTCTVGYLKNYFNKVTDPELIEFFEDQYDIGSGDGILTNTSSHQYIKKEGKLYRRKLFSPPQELKKEDKTNFTIRPSKLSNDKNEQDLSQLGAASLPASSLPHKIKPPVDWKRSVYSDIMGGEGKKAEEKVEKYIEFTNLGRNKKKEDFELNLLSSEQLERLQKEVNELKRPCFEKLKDKYISDSTTLQVAKSQCCISKQLYDLEMQQPERNRDDALIASHLSLKSSLVDQEIRLKKLGSEILELVERKSPYYVSEISMPKLGQKDTFDMEALKMFPIVGSDDDISIKDLFEWLSSWAEDLGLSEKGLKRAIFSRLRGSRAKAWLSYQKQPLKEAITSLSLLFDKNESPQKFANEIKHFSRGANENIENSVQRLIRAIDKWLEGRSDHDKSVLRREYLLDKLDKLLSPRALREVFRVIEHKQQLGEQLGEQELLSNIYKEDLFDKRSEQSSFKLNNVSANSSKDDDIDSLCEEFSNLHINALEHKRPFNADTENTRPNFKHARNDRPVIKPVRRFEGQNGQNPIVIGNQGKPLIRVGNPNPNNKWHNRSQNQNTYSRPNESSNYSQSRNQFLGSRNAPLQQQSNFKPRYDRNVEFDRRHQFNDYNRPQYQNGFNGRQRYNSHSGYNSQFRNSYGQDRGGLRHNLQFRTNPPAIFQQISLEELNAMCVECPKGEGQHSVAQCPKSKVFRKAPNKEKWT